MRLRTIRTAVGPEYLIVTADGLGITPTLGAIRAAVGLGYLTMAADGVTR